MNYRIAAVSFLNTVPLIDWFETTESASVQLMRALPSRLAALLRAGEADVGLLPVVEIFRGHSDGVVSSSGIACDGDVDTVKLYAAGDPGDLKRVSTDRGSRTSVALLRILLAELYGCRPDFLEAEPRATDRPAAGEGMLVIGDRCFEFEANLRETGTTTVQAWDLGGLWRQMTGLPFVFAAWATAPGFPARVGEQAVATLAALLDRARDHGLENLDALARREAQSGQLGHQGQATAEAIAYYFRQSLCYRIGEPELAGIRLFHELCIKHGEAPAGSRPVFR